MAVDTLQQHEALVRSLMSSAHWPDGGADRRRIDTHISSVVLAGNLAYKIKKPLDLGFLDFRSLDDRRHACEEELRLNRRLAPEIYQAVCAIGGTTAAPQIGVADGVIDWAVRMRRFDPDAILSNPDVTLTRALIDELAVRVGRFHVDAEVAADDSDFGRSSRVAGPMRQNFIQIGRLLPRLAARLEPLRQWTEARLDAFDAYLSLRRDEGHVRECHGDLHLGNIALIDANPVVFDAIEFNAGLRWIDTINDVAFLTMDLHHRAQAALACRFVDRYLQQTGDYAGLRVLQLYEVYRAMVRAKIAAIRQAQLAGEQRVAVEAELSSYIDLAARLAAARDGALLITHGPSGSGKSHVSKDLVDVLPVVRIRSDVERKRLLGSEANEDITAVGGYSAALTERTYARLADLAGDIIAAGFIVVVDATFLDRRQRARFAELARRQQVPFAIIDCEASEAVLRERILSRRSRADNVSDADVAVMQAQLARRDPLDDGERARCIAVAPGCSLDLARLRDLIAR